MHFHIAHTIVQAVRVSVFWAVNSDCSIYFMDFKEQNCNLTNTIRMDAVIAAGIKQFQMKRRTVHGNLGSICSVAKLKKEYS